MRDWYENTYFCHSCESENPGSFIFMDAEQIKDTGCPIKPGMTEGCRGVPIFIPWGVGGKSA